jgi:hypothetical protein
MPTEPHTPTLSEVVRRAVEIVEPDGVTGDMERFWLEFEDRDEPISAVDDLQTEVLDVARRGAEGVLDPGVWMAAAVTTYLGFRRDQVDDDDDEVLRLAARAEFHGNPPPEVAEWLEERGVDV